MTDLIEKWLLNSIGVNIEVRPENLGKACFDGTLFAKILNKYGICSYEYVKLIPRTDRYETAYANLKKLCVWFKLLGIPYNDDFLSSIASISDSAALKLLYELFLRLESCEELRFVDWQRKEWLLSESTPMFTVDQARLSEQEGERGDVDRQYLAESLRKGKEVIEKYKNLERSALEKRLEDNEKRKKSIQSLRKKVNTKIAVVPKKNKEEFEFYKTIAEFEERIKRKPCKKEEIINCGLTAYASFLKFSRRKLEGEERMVERMEMETLDDAWSVMLTKKEEVARDVLAKKLLKQSEQEYQMVKRLSRARFRYKTFLENVNMVKGMEEKQGFISDFKEKFHEDDTEYMDKLMWKSLHDQLFKQKVREKYLAKYRMCTNILYDMIDYCIVYHNYKEKNKEAPTSKQVFDWKLLFIKELPLLDQEDLLTVQAIRIDNEVSGTLAAFEFHQYMNLLGDWYPKQYEELAKERKERLNVLGFIVHKILDLRYRIEMPLGKPADIPHYNFQVLLRPVNNLFVIQRLKDFLHKPGIAVIDINTAVSYVVNAYKTTTDEYNQTKKTKTPLSRRSSVSTTRSSVTKLLDQSPERAKSPGIEKCSTRKSCSELGKIISNYLSDGLPLPDILTSQAIIEYIRDLKDIKGWVLLNYPQNLTQVAILEYMLSGWEVPFIKDVDSSLWEKIKMELQDKGIEKDTPELEKGMEELSSTLVFKPNSLKKNYMSPEKNLNEGDIETIRPSVNHILVWKNSEILPNPKPGSEIPNFQSFFTKVIVIENKSGVENDFNPDVKASLDLESENILCMQPSGTVEDFYFCLGIGESFPYKKFNQQTLYNLARAVINEPTSEGDVDWNSAIDLFGFDKLVMPRKLKEETETPSAVDKTLMCPNLLEEPKYDRPRLETLTKSLLQSDTIDSTRSQMDQDDELYISDEFIKEFREEKMISEDTKSKRSKKVPRFSLPSGVNESICYPGDPEWTYSNITTPDYFTEPLASIWETTEYYYKRNLHEVFHLIRTLESQLLPYRNYILKTSEECVNLPDDRPRLVTNFQLMYNGIREHQRSVNQFKNELHCRAFELQCNLWRLADLKKAVSKQRLFQLKVNNWLAKSVCNLLKSFLLLYQIEVDRFVDTMQIVNDYYSVFLTNQFVLKRPSKIVLPMFEWDSPNSPGGTPSKEKKSRRSKRSFFKTKKSQTKLTLETTDLFENAVPIYCEDVMDQDSTALLECFDIITNHLKIRVESYKENFMTISESIWESWLLPKEKERKKSRGKVPLTPETNINYDRVLDEWKSALEDETDRVLFRISLIHARSSSVVKKQINVIEKAFADFWRDVVQQYHVEMQNIDRLYDVICAAIESEERIQPALVLSGKLFQVDSSKAMFPSPPPPPPTRLMEEQERVGLSFTTAQLANLMSKLSYVAPLGLKKTSLVMILQDMALMGHELGHPYLPPVWSNMSEQEVEEHVHRWFGDRAFVDWRQLIIFGLDLPYPTIEELLDAKRQFVSYDPDRTEVLTLQQYQDTLIWFEKTQVLGLSNDLRKAKAKDLLFKLFRVAHDQINYTCLLLAFCRAEEPEEGFVKSLAVVEASMTIPWKVDLEREEEQIHEETEIILIVDQIIEEIIFAVCKIYDVIVTDYIEETSEEDLIDEMTNILEKRRTADLNDEEDLRYSHSIDTNAHAKSEVIYLRPTNIRDSEIWKSDVHIDTILSIFSHYLYRSIVSPDQLKELVQLKENLSRIYANKGDGITMKFFKLLNDDYIKGLISSNRLFHEISITKCIGSTTKKSPELYFQKYLK